MPFSWNRAVTSVRNPRLASVSHPAFDVMASWASGTRVTCVGTTSSTREYPAGAEAALAPYLAAAEEARRQGLGLNAGHDLNLENLRFFVSRIPWTDEVSIGHALICDALYYGLENTVQLYKRELR